MSKVFRKIKVDPLTSLNSLNLKISEVKHIDLNDLPPDEAERRVTEAFKFIKKFGEAIVAVKTGDEKNEAVITSVLNSSQNKGQIILLQEPNPVHLYLQIANEHLEAAQPLRNMIRSRNRVDNYFGLLTNYFEEVSQGIIFLVMTLEGFFDQGIQMVPEGYFLDEAGSPLTKNQLEWIDFNSKIRYVMPVISGFDYYTQFNEKYNKIVRINDLRNDLTHLKVSQKKNMTRYEDLNKRLIDFNPLEASELVFHYIMTLYPGYFTEDV
ncbi:hypothetical protein [Rudanella lutea]|uniref:hypothetical protein n=1 Tax=Rudanella lutea TaxID=451374 RepID=UPI00037F431A|nr:hypothetical protein [Rudanella lutea]